MRERVHGSLSIVWDNHTLVVQWEFQSFLEHPTIVPGGRRRKGERGVGKGERGGGRGKKEEGRGGGKAGWGREEERRGR